MLSITKWVLLNLPAECCIADDSPSYQVVNLEFSGGQTCSFTMVAFTEKICDRETRIHFTNGELIGDMHSFTTTSFPEITISGKDEHEENSKDNKTKHQPSMDVLSGHGGGDIGLIATFVEAVKLGRQEILGLTVDDILNSHLTVSILTLSKPLGDVLAHLALHFSRSSLLRQAVVRVASFT